MFLALNALRPTSFSILYEDGSYVFRTTVPLSLRQVVDTISIEGVSSGLVHGSFSFSDNDMVAKLDCITVKAFPDNTSCVLTIAHPSTPLVSLLGGLSIVW